MNNDGDERTVDELLAAADEFASTSGSLSSQLASIMGNARGNGVLVSVDLHGKLVGLQFDQQAMYLSPDELAAKIQQLAEEASAAAMSDGVAALAEVVDDSLYAELTEHMGLSATRQTTMPPSQRRASTAEFEGDTLMPTTWRMS
jgi:hypothetical protein